MYFLKKIKKPKTITFISFGISQASLSFNKLTCKDLIMATFPCKSNKKKKDIT